MDHPRAHATGLPGPAAGVASRSDCRLLADAYQPGTPSTRAASNVGKTKATLHGAVNPDGSRVRVRFDFGRTTSYGRETAFRVIQPADVVRTFLAALTGLPTNTKFHYRAEVRTDFGVLFGPDRTFTTLHG